MSDRERDLRDLAARLRDDGAVHDAFVAKSFTDTLLVLDLERDESLPEDVRQLLEDRDLRGANEVYDDDATDRSFAGDIGDSTRHHFVDVRARREHRHSPTN